MYIEIEKDENFDNLVKIGHKIISAFLEKGVIKKKDLSHIRFNKVKEMWIPDQYHMTVLRANKSPIDATNVIQDHSEACLGTF